jgi:two-component system, NarL family, sensor kinase
MIEPEIRLAESSTISRPPEGTATAALERIADRVEQLSARNERLLERVVEGESRFRVLARAVWKAQEDERRRLARELHDSVGQTITALIAKLRQAQQSGRMPDLESAVDIATLALNDVRELSRLLRPPILDDLGLQAGLNWLCRTLREHRGLSTTLDWHAEEFERLDPELETLIFRVAQEALHNVIQHSGRREARMMFRRARDHVEFAVSDDGCGFDGAAALTQTESVKGLGLRGIRDRVELFGGRLEIDSTLDRGACIRVTVPTGESP